MCVFSLMGGTDKACDPQRQKTFIWSSISNIKKIQMDFLFVCFRMLYFFAISVMEERQIITFWFVGSAIWLFINLIFCLFVCLFLVCEFSYLMGLCKCQVSEWIICEWFRYTKEMHEFSCVEYFSHTSSTQSLPSQLFYQIFYFLSIGYKIPFFVIV